MTGGSDGTDWIEPLLGVPWRRGATGPDAYDCWGLARAVERERYGRELPALGVDPDDAPSLARALRAFVASAGWRRVTQPRDGDGVVMRLAERGSLHVGVWVDANGGSVLHVPRGGAVVLSSPAQLAMAGWIDVRYYRPR